MFSVGTDSYIKDLILIYNVHSSRDSYIEDLILVYNIQFR